MFSLAGRPGRRFSDRYHRRARRVARVLLAGESRGAARWLDATEVRLRALARRLWRR